MSSQLTVVEIHLWVLTGVVCLLAVGNILCNYRHAKRNDGYPKMKRMWEAGKHPELLAYASARLRRSPASPFPLMYKAMALLRLGRLDEAEATVKQFKEVAPTMHSEATSLLKTVSDLRAAAEG